MLGFRFNLQAKHLIRSMAVAAWLLLGGCEQQKASWVDATVASDVIKISVTVDDLGEEFTVDRASAIQKILADFRERKRVTQTPIPTRFCRISFFTADQSRTFPVSPIYPLRFGNTNEKPQSSIAVDIDGTLWWLKTESFVEELEMLGKPTSTEVN